MSVARSRFRMMEHEAPEPAARPFPIGWLVLGSAAVLCLALWTTSAKVLLASDLREGGRLLACRYFTGTGVVERQYLQAAGEAARHACPLVRRG